MPCAAPAQHHCPQPAASPAVALCISGDLPIVLIRIGDMGRIDLVKQVVQAMPIADEGPDADLVIVERGFLAAIGRFCKT